MRIGLLAPPWVPVPPPGYGGTEAVVDNLARGLRARGHDIRLFTVGESTCPVPRTFRYATAVEPMGASIPEAAHVLAGYEALDDVDLVHDHTILGPLLAGYATGARRPSLVTHHGVFDDAARRIFRAAAHRSWIVAISRSHAATAGDVPISAVVHHGIDLDAYRPGDGSGNYLLFIGRMTPVKGAHRAVRIAHRAGIPIVLVAKARTTEEKEYFAAEVAPLLGRDDTVLEEAPLAERAALLRRATALLDPIEWDEPFGLVMAEALACGTPVIAFPRGAAPEIVDHGVTGFLCSDEHGMADAVARVGRIDRHACRSAAVARFSLQRMAQDYETIYERLLNAPDLPRPRVVRPTASHRPDHPVAVGPEPSP